MKEEENKEQNKKIASFAKALSHPTRVEIIRILLETSKCTCGENCKGKNCNCGCRCGSIVDQFPMAQSTISQHIKELKMAGLINISGRKGNYILNHSKLNEGLSFLRDFFNNNPDENNMKDTTNCQCDEVCSCSDL